ncbi:MAG: ATP-binding cassette domain-containing protein [Candidatus Aenigmarchaeota archaeon]|nr:ATP-binding cassette domain-containing protein [Candidatus Aenigmarchaeota archaeon]
MAARKRSPIRKKPIVQIEGLTKKFGDFTAVDNISFTIQEGEIFGFLGPNGAGKSTTLSMLATLMMPDGGKAAVNGFDVVLERDSVRSSIGMVFQDSSLDEELTAYENMDFHGRLYGVPPDERKKNAHELLKLVGLDDRSDSLVKTFSGGMRRRLEIARGLLHEPKVLFLDEPTLGLDPQTRNKIWDYVKRLNRENGLTIILTTHYMDEADKLCNRIAIIDRGKIIVAGSSQELKDTIGGDVVTMETKDREKIGLLMKGCKWCKSVKIHDGQITLHVQDAGKRVPEILDKAYKNKIKIGFLTINKPTLEDVFLHYTGKTIREQEASSADVMRMRHKVWGGRR